MNINCLRCSEPYEQIKRRASHFCPACRTIIDRDKARERMRARRSAIAPIVSVMDPAVYPRLDEYLAAVDFDRATIVDRMPAGANSDAGPDEGRSTYDGDLAERLDNLSAQASAHRWFVDNPHWSYGLHDDDEAARYLNAA